MPNVESLHAHNFFLLRDTETPKEAKIILFARTIKQNKPRDSISLRFRDLATRKRPKTPKFEILHAHNFSKSQPISLKF
jgi:hypothetical protein